MKSKEIIKLETLNWVNRVVIGLNFCPFAAPVVTHNQLHVVVTESSDLASILEGLIEEYNFLESSDQYETSLFVLPNFGLKEDDSFFAYLDLVDLANVLLEEQGFSGIYQLATFHPEYRFAQSEKDDPANYTNRSPYPMFHIIPEVSLAEAIDSYPDVDQIPINNKKLARQKGLLAMEILRKGCFVETSS